MIFTTSWDDGNALDLRLASVLEHHGCTGTFYVSPRTSGLTNAEIYTIHCRHEVGAHSMTHPRLSSIHLDDAQREITESKKWIEQRIHAPCQMFCYPFGDENRQVHALVREAGFIGARNTQQLQWGVTDPFQMPTTLQIYPYPLRRRFVRRQDLLDPFSRLRMLYPSLKPLHLPLWAYCSWLGLAKALFLYGLQARKSIFHLWGHSWEVEKYGMWSSLEQFLIFVRSYNNVQHVTNTALINH